MSKNTVYSLKKSVARCFLGLYPRPTSDSFSMSLLPLIPIMFDFLDRYHVVLAPFSLMFQNNLIKITAPRNPNLHHNHKLMIYLWLYLEMLWPRGLYESFKYLPEKNSSLVHQIFSLLSNLFFFCCQRTYKLPQTRNTCFGFRVLLFA